ncbi:hypothetical protein M0R45_024153 [Rubus argutus]|uniref:Uncharacterized protein n=1 Tax=Rubus argutus TaxID=59490 RepID=A0AAW1WQR7_RUBAR
MSLPMTIMSGKLFTTSVENLKLGMWLDMRDDIRVLSAEGSSVRLLHNGKNCIVFYPSAACYTTAASLAESDLSSLIATSRRLFGDLTSSTVDENRRSSSLEHRRHCETHLQRLLIFSFPPG